jgi:hypothetical protein
MRFERSGRGQELSRGHKFSILENVVLHRDFPSSMRLHFRSDLVGACLPQTLLIIRALRHEWNGVSCLTYVPKPKKVKPNKVTVKQAEKAASNTIDESYDVPQKFLELYYRLHNAESLMRKSWEVTFDLNPKLLTHPEQVKVLRFALKPHLEFLKTLDEVLAESSGESSKTA